MKKGGAEIVSAPSAVKIDEMVGKNATNYEFPENTDIDSDKVSKRVKNIVGDFR